MNEYDVIVIGGGAAGMFAAVQAGYAGAKVLLLEPNDRLGKKLYITGKGRCNLTNACSWQEVLKSVPRNPRFLYSALSGFTPEDAVTFFESHGCETKVERGNRVFPVSDKSASVVEALKTALGYAGVEVFRARAKEILTDDGAGQGGHSLSAPAAASARSCHCETGPQTGRGSPFLFTWPRGERIAASPVLRHWFLAMTPGKPVRHSARPLCCLLHGA